ncbi:MAG: MBL fold metallo-hydrolase [Candidatus Nealsonbacteria bacterium]|nr:MBL fold metallo-hydrolase [Candidatus Nealsonbacteria bacterium]
MEWKIGKFLVRLAIKDYFSLDAGILFSGIPKEKWINWCRYPFYLDEQNRVRISVNCFLIKSDQGKSVLVDTSFGNTNLWKENTVKAFDMKNGFNLFKEGLPHPDFIIPTHLHFDHAGGFVEKTEENLVPAFPGSRYLIHNDEIRHAFSVHPKTRSSYLRETIEGVRLISENRLLAGIISGRFELLPGLTIIKTRGHTPGHVSIKIQSEGKTAFIPGALFPTRFHSLTACGVGNDTHALEAANHKIRFMRQAAKKNWLFLMEHDHAIAGFITAYEGIRIP